MTLKNISLFNFRNFSEATFQFSPQTTLVLGENGKGKTNLCEAIHLLSSGRSLRTGLESDLLSFGQREGKVMGQNDEERLEVRMRKEESLLHKQFLIDGLSKRMIDFLSHLPLVIFGPEDIGLVSGSPSLRRRYLDRYLAQVSKDYRHALSDYENALIRRNRVLERIREGRGKRDELLFWDQLMTKNGQFIQDKRLEFFEFLSQDKDILPSVSFSYKPSIRDFSLFNDFLEQDLRYARTLRGIHRDDFSFLKNSENLAFFGSRAEQRLAVLKLKILELEFLTQKTSAKPILILDDILSELDKNNKKLALSLVKKGQTIITATAKDQSLNSLDLSLINL